MKGGHIYFVCPRSGSKLYVYLDHFNKITSFITCSIFTLYTNPEFVCNVIFSQETIGMNFFFSISVNDVRCDILNIGPSFSIWHLPMNRTVWVTETNGRARKILVSGDDDTIHVYCVSVAFVCLFCLFVCFLSCL